MTITHICTTNSLRAGINQPPFNCCVCDKQTMFVDWVGSKCDTCGADTAWEENLAGFVRSIRQRTKLTRKEIAQAAGLKPSTIKSYEWKHPSRKYYDWFRGFIKEFYEKPL